MVENTSNNKNKYENTKIYIITDNGYTEKYIGSTTQELSSRMAQHRAHYRRWKDGVSGSVSIFELFEKYGVENCKIQLLEEYPCENKNQMMRREGYHILNEICVNKIVAGQTYKEYYEANKEQIQEYKKKYYENEENKKHKKEKDKQHYEENKENITQKVKEYREKNIEKIREYDRQRYYRKNRVTIGQHQAIINNIS